MEISSKQIPKKTSTKEYLEKHAYQKKPKEKSLQKKPEEKIIPLQKIKQFFYQKLSRKIQPRKL